MNEPTHPPLTPHPERRLTPHQERLLVLRRRGLSNSAVAKMFHVQPQTIKNQMHEIYKKIGVASPRSTVLSRATAVTDMKSETCDLTSPSGVSDNGTATDDGNDDGKN